MRCDYQLPVDHAGSRQASGFRWGHRGDFSHRLNYGSKGKPKSMKTYFIAILVLATSASSSRSEEPSFVDDVLHQDIGFAVDRATDFVRGGVNVFDHLSLDQRGDIRSCRLAYDVTEGIKSAVRTAASRGSGRVVLPDGCYRTTATITLPSDVELVGASMRATKIIPTGDFPAISALGTYAHGLTGVGVQNMSVICAGMSNPHAMGVKLVYVNRGNLKDLYFNGCRHALDLYDQWQTRVDNVTADGLGIHQNQVGVYMGSPTDPTNKTSNNAVIMSNSTMQNVALYGYELVFFAGSKFLNNEAMNGVTGWKLCGGPYMIPAQACQFGHFLNIVADTTRGPGIVVDQGTNANPINNVMFDHVWIGSSGGHALYLAGITYSQFDNVHVTSSDNGVYLHNSSNVKVGVNIAGYNQNDNGSHAAVISGGSDNTLWATNSRSGHPNGYNGIAEIGPTHGNSIWGGLSSCNLDLAFGDGRGRRGPVYAVRSCQYEVQGRQVRITFRLGLSGLGLSSGPAVLTGLPFVAHANASSEAALLGSSMVNLSGAIIAQIVPGSSIAKLYIQGITDPVALTKGNFSTSSAISGTLEYTKN